MKTGLPNLLGAAIRDYSTDHLPRLRGTSPHTIHSYRDSIVLLLRFAGEHVPGGCPQPVVQTANHLFDFERLRFLRDGVLG